MLVQKTIEEKLQKAFSPQYLEVLNESHMHSVPENSETHFKVTLVSAKFNAVRKVQRHQQAYAALQQELQEGVHALALHLYTEEEWQARENASPDSPNCLGGSKKESAQ
jgi:BolA protein